MAPPKKGGEMNLAGYKYTAMSNLVLQADRRFITRRGDENTGDPESLAGHINIHEMGGRTARSNAPLQKRKQQNALDLNRGSIHEGEAVLAREQRKRKRDDAGKAAQVDFAVEGLRYRPRTAASRATYELITTIVGKHLGDVPHHVTRSAADAVLEYLKDEELKDFDKKKEIDELLGTSMGPKEFNELVSLGNKITDYDAEDEEEEKEEVPEATDIVDGPEADEAQGVAVVFDEEEDEETAGQTFEVRDEQDSDDEEPANAEEGAEEEDAGATDGAKDVPEVEDVVVQGEVPDDDKENEDGIIPIHVIDAFWLQRRIGQIYEDHHTQQEKAKAAIEILAAEDENENKSLREIENDLMELFEFENHDLVATLLLNRERVVWVTRWKQSLTDNANRAAVERAMIAGGQGKLLAELRARDTGAATQEPSGPKKLKIELKDVHLAVPNADTEMPDAPQDGGLVGGLQPTRLINLENLVFDQGNHLMSNPTVKLPQGSTRRQFKGYEEIFVPAPKAKRGTNEPPLMPLSQLPDWAQEGFGRGNKTLNRIQTKCFPAAFESDGNMLICAPTGSGKTNVAMLAMLREIGKHRDPVTGQIQLDDFKIIYIAPLKALVAEQVGNFSKRLEPYGIRVSELTGDRQLTKQQIVDTQIIVTTPEKYDVITRKATDLSYINLVRLICIDEIHLLHDDRGPVLESIVSRTIRRSEQTGDTVRLVGLSATLPNYRDVATFLQVDPDQGLFHFDATFRPCPLQQEFIGVSDKKAIKQLKTMNDVCYTKVLDQVGKNRNQMLIFVHSRKDTAKTAKYIRDKALDEGTVGQILRADTGVAEMLREESTAVQNADLKDLMPYGFGIHHAGMTRADRTTVEDLFSEGAIQVLVCTATLAWGVNLPAHTVIIKGTQVYSPEKGSWVELSPQDVLQMLGRAGRPQYDTYGEGIIITTQNELQYYLSLLNQQLPIESQFMSKLADNLNAEIVLGNIRTRDEGVEWLGYTYLFVRMLRSPGLYSVGAEYEKDAALEQKRVDLIHSAAVVLEKCNLAKYDRKSGKLLPTELGRIASHYYITHKSMATYNQHIQPSIGTIELFRVFALSEEFKYIPVRQDEKLELAKLLGRVPIPVKESIEEPHAKINVLLQAYISRLMLEGLALMADLVYVTQSAGRILRAIFEISLKKGFASVAKTALSLCKMAEKRMWPTMSPLRQYAAPNASCPMDVIRKAERIDVPWSSYFDLDPPKMSELLGMPKAGKLVCNLVQKFPRLELEASWQPMTRTMLRMELLIRPNFEWDDELHGHAESFWIIVEDCDGEEILYHDQFLLRKEYAISENNEHVVNFTIPITEPLQPHCFITVVSDRWMHGENKIVTSLQKLVLPDKFPPYTPLLELQPLPIASLKRRDFMDLYKDIDRFNRIQTQVFGSLYSSDDNVLVGAAPGLGKTLCAEFAMLRQWAKSSEGRIVYLTPFQELVETQFKNWTKRLSHLGDGKEIVKLTGDSTTDLRLAAKADLILATPAQWDVLSRRKKNQVVRSVTLLIADELHAVGGYNGHVYESVVSRMHAKSVQDEREMRIVGLSVSVANARDLGTWIRANKHTIFNFSPHVRAVPLELHIQSFTIPHFPSMMLAMARPTYQAIIQHSPDQPAMVFVPNRKQVRATARDLFGACIVDNDEDRFLNAPLEDLQPILDKINEPALAESLSHGIGYFHEALTSFDKKAVQHLFNVGAIQVMIVSRDSCWEVENRAHLVVVMGTQFYEGREHRYVDYPVSELLRMFGRAGRVGEDKIARGVLMVPAVKRDYYKKFLNEALPVESSLYTTLPDVLVAEIASGMVESLQEAMDWSTYTYFYHRLLGNPAYYGLYSTSPDDFNTHLSEVVEGALNDLVEANVIELDEEEDEITPLNPAMIAAHYNISFYTMQTLLMSLNNKTPLKTVLEIVTAATEFETLPIRRHEDHILRRIYDRVPWRMSDVNYETPHFKAYVLLQAHFARMQLPVDLVKDQEIVLKKVPSLLSACVDVLSSEGHLNAMRAIELHQMAMQAMWPKDSPLKQIPHFDNDTVKAASQFGVNEIEGFINAMDPEENEDYGKLIEALGLNEDQLAEAAAFTNEFYPSVDMSFEVEDADDIVAGAPAYINVHISRDNLDEDDEVKTNLHAPFYPAEKSEAWWLVVGDVHRNSLLAIKQMPIGRKVDVKLEFTVPEPGGHELNLFLMCNGYLGVDQAPSFQVSVAEGMSEDEEDEDEE